jgi:hypothetical protein
LLSQITPTTLFIRYFTHITMKLHIRLCSMIIRKDASTALFARPAASTPAQNGDERGGEETRQDDTNAADLTASSREKCVKLNAAGIDESDVDRRFFMAFSHLVFIVAQMRQYASPGFPPCMYPVMMLTIITSAILIYGLVWRDIHHWGRKNCKKLGFLFAMVNK